jgi:peroxiredoxin
VRRGFFVFSAVVLYETKKSLSGEESGGVALSGVELFSRRRDEVVLARLLKRICWYLVLAALVAASKKETNPSAQPGLKESPQEGYLAPGFSLENLRGESVSLADFRGKVILLNFWATWCPPCRREIPSLERLYELRKDTGFEIVAVSVDRTSLSRVSSFVADQRMSFPVLVNPSGDVGQRYWMRSVPSSFLLDKKGIIRWKVIGAREWDDAQTLAKIDQLLSE